MSALSTEGLNGFPIPIGTVLMWANNSSKPQLVADLEGAAGFLVCDGREFAIKDYPDLYRVLGGVANPYDAFPSAPAVDNFRIPNLPNPDGSGAPAIPPLIIGSTVAGTQIAPTGSGVAITSASITLRQENIPSFDLDYDTATPFKVSGDYYSKSSVDGSEINAKVYSKSNTMKRNAASGNKFLRTTETYSTDGGIGNDTIAPLVSFNGNAEPIDITGDIVQGSFTAPTFQIVPIIRARPSIQFSPSY